MRNKLRTLAVAAGLLIACSLEAKALKVTNEVGNKLCAGEACFDIETVRTPEGRSRGLMFRDELKEGQGMFFIFSQPDLYSFWMKNMKFPIDIVWLSGDKRIVHIEKNVPPCQKDPCPVYNPGRAALYVLEVPAGAAEEAGLKVGDRMEMR